LKTLLHVSALFLLLASSLASAQSPPSSPDIYLLAGTGTQSFSGDSGPAIDAGLGFPIGEAIDAAGNLYFADLLNQRIRRIDAVTGIITTVAGNGTVGYSGDNGPAVNAELNYPYGVASDQAGNLYIADTENGRIRRVDAATGIITTMAGNGNLVFSGGGQAISTAIGGPERTALDSAGNLYISDILDMRILKVEAATGIVTSVAGNGTETYSGDGGPATDAGLCGPEGIALDSAGNIYISDTGNNRIRKVTAATGIITTVAGIGPSSENGIAGIGGFSGDGGPATSAELDWPFDVALDAAGGLFIADAANLRIRWVDATTGIITTVAGDGIPGIGGFGEPATDAPFEDPLGVLVDSKGSVYIADSEAGMVLIVGPKPQYSGVIPTTTALTSSLNTLGFGQSVTLTASVTAASGTTPTGTVIFLNGTASLGTATLNSSGIATLTLTPPVGAYSITASYSGSSSDALSVSAPSVVILIQTITITASTSTVPVGQSDLVTITVTPVIPGPGPEGNVLIQISGQGNQTLPLANGRVLLDFSSAEAGYYGITATLITGPSDTGGPKAAIGITVTNSPNIYLFAGSGSEGAGGDGCLALAAQLDPVYSIASDAAGDVYIADFLGNQIRKVDGATGIITTVAGTGVQGFSGDGGPATSAEFNNPYGVALDAAGDIYVADTENYRIRRINAATGVITTVAGNGTEGYSGDGGPATSAEINYVVGIGSDAAGNLYIGDNGTNRVRKVDVVTGVITTVAGDGAGGFSGDGGPAASAELADPLGSSLDAAGNLYIVDSLNNRIRMVAATTGIITTVAGDGTAGYSGDGGPAIDAEISTGILGVASDPAGNLYIPDIYNNRIRRIDAATGIITTVAGDGVLGLSGIGGPAIDAEIFQPTTVTLDAAGNIYLESFNYGQILIVGAQPSYPLIATTTTLTAVPTTLTAGQTLMLTANASAATCATPTGTVTFLNGTTPLGTATLNPSGIATLTLTPPVGVYSITAGYGGSSLDAPSVSAPPAQVTVNPAPAATTALLTASPNPAAFGANVTFTVAVSGAAETPTGSVSFFDGTVPLGTATLASGTATYSTSSLSVGRHSITAQYAGDTQFAACASNAVVETISQADFSIAVAPASQSVDTGESAAFTVTITPGADFNLPVALSCSALPAATTCGFSPASINATGSSTLTVQTTAPGQPASAFVIASGAGATALAGLFLLFVPARRKAWSRFFALVLLLLAGMTALGGCSGSRSLLGGTPLGPQTITINAVATNGSQTLAHQATLTLNVKSLF